MNHKMLHEAYELSRDAEGRKNLEEHLLKLFPDETPEDVAKAIRMVSSLKDHAYNVALDIRDNLLSMSEAVGELKRRAPGFDRKTYERAIGNGLFESR